jgi:hypothetical protein
MASLNFILLASLMLMSSCMPVQNKRALANKDNIALFEYSNVIPTITPTPLPIATATPLIVQSALLANKLFKDFLQRLPSRFEVEQFSSLYDSAQSSNDKYIIILDFLNRDDVIRLKIAEWYDLIWHDTTSLAELANSSKINNMLTKYKRQNSVYEIFAVEYYNQSFYERSRLFDYLRENSIRTPFGVISHDYAWVHMLYPYLFERPIDQLGTYTYSQIANNYSKKTMTYTVMNAYSGEIHLTTAARWYKRYLKRTESIEELKLDQNVITLSNLMSNDNYRDVEILAELLNSGAFN